jgi:hypothetical protein
MVFSPKVLKQPCYMRFPPALRGTQTTPSKLKSVHALTKVVGVVRMTLEPIPGVSAADQATQNAEAEKILSYMVLSTVFKSLLKKESSGEEGEINSLNALSGYLGPMMAQAVSGIDPKTLADFQRSESAPPAPSPIPGSVGQ